MNDSSISFRNRVALVTGGTSGLGRAAAIAFARAGARVMIAGRSQERGREVVAEIESMGAEARFVPADVSRSDEIRKLLEAVAGEYGRIDFAFNNASELGAQRPLAECEESDFDEVVAVDLKSVWLCMKLEIERMLAQDPPGGAIVNTSSVNGLGGVPAGSLYAMAKAGVIALTKSAALEYAQRGIRVNALVPGAFDTPMMNGVLDRMSGGDPSAREQLETTLNGAIAMGRMGKPEEAAAAVIWLCSDAASYVTGQTFIIDGGMTAPYR